MRLPLALLFALLCLPAFAQDAAQGRARGRFQRRSRCRGNGALESAAGRNPPLRGGVQRGQGRLCRTGRRQEADAFGDPRPAAGPGSAQHLLRQGRRRRLRRAGHRRLRRRGRGTAAAAGQHPEGDRADRRHARGQGRDQGRRRDPGHRRQADQRRGRHGAIARRARHQTGPERAARRQGQAFRRHPDPRDHPRGQRARADAGTGLRLHAHQRLPGRYRRRVPAGVGQAADRRETAAAWSWTCAAIRAAC